MTTTNPTYWTATTLLVLGLLSGGIAEVMQRPDNVEGMLRLGYPMYFGIIIGLWKIAGSVAILAPGFGRLKEWAYAGVFFNMTGAAASHAIVGEPAWHVAVTLGFAALAVVSWATRPKTRVLGSLATSLPHSLSGQKIYAAGSAAR
jgi:hypothetical protein